MRHLRIGGSNQDGLPLLFHGHDAPQGMLGLFPLLRMPGHERANSYVILSQSQLPASVLSQVCSKTCLSSLDGQSSPSA